MNTLAELAGVPPSTISRIEAGKLEPTFLMLMRILQAAGFTFDNQLKESGSDQPFDSYIRRLKKSNLDIQKEPAKNLLAVASSAPIAKRNGVTRYELGYSLRDVVLELERQGQSPVVSSLESWAGSIDSVYSFTPIVYVDNPSIIKNLKPANSQSSQILFLLPLTKNAQKNMRAVRGFNMTSRAWGMLDALASPGRQPDAALETLRDYSRSVA